VNAASNARAIAAGVDAAAQGYTDVGVALSNIDVKAMADGISAMNQGFSDVGASAPVAAQGIEDAGGAAENAQMAFFDAAAGLSEMNDWHKKRSCVNSACSQMKRLRSPARLPHWTKDT